MTWLVVLAVAAGAVAQSVSGIGFTLVSGPLVVAALGSTQGVRLSIVLSLVVNVLVLARTYRHASPRDVALLLVPAVVATPVLAHLLRSVPERVGSALAGAAAVVGAVLLAAGLRWRALGGRTGAVAAGIASAAMNVVAGIGGPAIALYAANARWPAEAMRSTGQVYFLVLNVVAAASVGLPDVGLRLVLGCLLALVVGQVVGGRVVDRVSEPAARRVTLTLAGLGGLLVLLAATRA